MKTHFYKNIEFFEWDPPATHEQITAAEFAIGSKLPSAYCEFLLHTNGGLVQNKPSFAASFHYREPRLWAVAGLNGVEPCKSDSIERERYSYEFNERVPDLIVPIGTLFTSLRICLALRKKDYGHIYIWAPRHLLSGDNDYPNKKTMTDLYFIASSFAEFLAMLEPKPD